jgi:hypothetical protein
MNCQTALSDTEEDDARLPRPPFHMEAYEKLSGISAQFEQTIRHFKEPVDLGMAATGGRNLACTRRQLIVFHK